MIIPFLDKSDITENIVDKMNSNYWTEFKDKNIRDVILREQEEYSRSRIPVEHNNAIFKRFLKQIKIRENPELNSQQCEALLDSFGMKLVYEEFDSSGLYESLKLCSRIVEYFHTKDKCPGIDISFLGTINIGRDNGNIIVRLLPRESGKEYDIADLLHIDSNGIVLMNYLFAFEYIFHNDIRFQDSDIRVTFDNYYLPFVNQLKDKINGVDNNNWVINKFPIIFAEVIAYDNSGGKFDFISADDLPNMGAMKKVLKDTAAFINKKIVDGKVVLSPYMSRVIEQYGKHFGV